MGQMTMGLMYGCKAPEGADDEYGDVPMIERWNKLKRVTWQSPRPKIEAIYGDVGGLHIGVWIAVGASGKTGVAYFDTGGPIPIHGIEDRFRAALATARALWDAFAAHAKAKSKITLPDATLWLLATEVA